MKGRGYEFYDMQAVILAGPGQRLHPFIEDKVMPKCMLPIANQPMIFYPLSWLHRCGFPMERVIVVCTQSSEIKLRPYLKEMYEYGKIELVVQPEDSDGTIAAIKAVRDKIWKNLIIIPCDLITDQNLEDLINWHKVREADVTLSFCTNRVAGYGRVDAKPTLAEKEMGDGVYVGLDENLKKLTFLADRLPEDDSGPLVTISHLLRYPCLVMHGGLWDSHIYIFSTKALDSPLLFEQENSFSIREDVLPLLLKFNEGLRVTGYINKKGFQSRVNTVRRYVEANNQMLQLRVCEEGIAATKIPRIALSAEISSKAQFGVNSICADRVQIGEKASVKKSSLGLGVRIGQNVKLNNCILMDYVVINDNCILENVIAGPFALIEEKCQLKDVEVGNRTVISQGTIAKNEIYNSST